MFPARKSTGAIIHSGPFPVQGAEAARTFRSEYKIRTPPRGIRNSEGKKVKISFHDIQIVRADKPAHHHIAQIAA
jgi:hypothetical protein